MENRLKEQSAIMCNVKVGDDFTSLNDFNLDVKTDPLSGRYQLSLYF